MAEELTGRPDLEEAADLAKATDLAGYRLEEAERVLEGLGLAWSLVETKAPFGRRDGEGVPRVLRARFDGASGQVELLVSMA